MAKSDPTPHIEHVNPGTTVQVGVKFTFTEYEAALLSKLALNLEWALMRRPPGWRVVVCNDVAEMHRVCQRALNRAHEPT